MRRSIEGCWQLFKRHARYGATKFGMAPEYSQKTQNVLRLSRTMDVLNNRKL